MGWKSTAARKAATAAVRLGTGDGGIGTDRAHGRQYCRFCGRPVKSRLGSVCSRPRCHQRAVLAEED